MLFTTRFNAEGSRVGGSVDDEKDEFADLARRVFDNGREAKNEEDEDDDEDRERYDEPETRWRSALWPICDED